MIDKVLALLPICEPGYASGVVGHNYLVIDDAGEVKAWLNQRSPTGYGWDYVGQISPGVGATRDRAHLTDLNGDRRAEYLVVEPPDGSTPGLTHTRDSRQTPAASPPVQDLLTEEPVRTYGCLRPPGHIRAAPAPQLPCCQCLSRPRIPACLAITPRS